MGVYVNQGDTLTIQFQGSNNYTQGSDAITAGVSAILQKTGFGVSDVQVQSSSILNAVEDLSLIEPFFAQMDVTAGEDYASSDDVLSIFNNAYYQTAGVMPTSSTVSDINGVGTGQSTGGNQSQPNSPSGIGTTVTNFLSGLQQFGTTALIIIALIVIALVFALTTSGGSSVARAALP